MKPTITFLVPLILLLLAQSARANQEQQWHFNVFLDGSCDSRLTQKGDSARELQSNARFDVKFLFFTAYRYRHSDTEIWRGNCLQSIDAYTNDNGDKYFVRGSRNGQGFDFASAGTEITTPECVKTFAYWDPSILKARRLLNSQTGEFVDIEVKLVGRETIPVRGRQVQANRYRLVSELGDIDLWYALDGYRWLALQSTTESGRKISYRMN